MLAHRDLIIALAARYRLPAIYPFRYFAESGGLMSYGNVAAALAKVVWRLATSSYKPPIMLPTASSTGCARRQIALKRSYNLVGVKGTDQLLRGIYSCSSGLYCPLRPSKIVPASAVRF
jgi:hypothetical protein